MRPTTVARPIAHAAAHLPVLKRMPVLKLLAVAEIGLLAREHMMLLDRDERRRLVKLIRAGRRRSSLTEAEREELASLVAKTQPRLLVGHAVNRLSPVPLPSRMVYGRTRARRKAM